MTEKRFSCKVYLTDCVDSSFALTATEIREVSTPEFGKVNLWNGFLELKVKLVDNKDPS